MLKKMVKQHQDQMKWNKTLISVLVTNLYLKSWVHESSRKNIRNKEEEATEVVVKKTAVLPERTALKPINHLWT